MKRGTLVVVSGPAGVGKGTVIKCVVDNGGGSVCLSVSATTRKPRANDVEGVTYYFKTREEFKGLIDNDEMLEWAVYSDNFYGTPKKAVFDALEKGIDVILEIEVQGAMQILEKYPESVFVFIAPPDLNELRNRITARATETPEEIEKRLGAANEEMKYMEKYNYIIVNNTVAEAAEELMAILKTSRAM